MKWRLPSLKRPKRAKAAPAADRWRIDFDLDRNPTLARIRALPKSGQWAVAAVAVLMVWLALEQWSWSWARSWAEQADRIERALADSSELASSVDPLAGTGAELFGPVDPPGSESEGAEAMARAVVDVVKKHSVSQFSYDAQRASTRLGGAQTAFGSQRLSRVQGELQFEATPAETAKIIAELESSPAIEAVSAVRMQRRENDNRVGVRMTVEAWVFAARSGAGRTS